ncbi:MAG TPA: PEP-CTERM sorting domain-containing protein [Vicinamibacterales bacterium]|nr:PEP-CTERM sorting domain-containing protein [Vicinamibacterales bacterium]
MKKLFIGILFTALIAVGATDAQATTILPNCGTCGNHNTAWDLTLSLIDDTNNIYQLTAKATYGAPVDFAFVNAVAYKVDPFTNQYDANPTVTGPQADDTWNVVGGGINSGGCSGSGNGYFCANSAGFGASHGAAGTTDTWVFLINISNTLPNLAGAVAGSFKAQFVNLEGVKVGSLLSEEVTFTFDSPPPLDVNTPEPATLIMFGTGLAAVATAIRRRKKAQPLKTRPELRT